MELSSILTAIYNAAITLISMPHHIGVVCIQVHAHWGFVSAPTVVGLLVAMCPIMRKRIRLRDGVDRPAPGAR
jgi:hypothetical protein